MITSSLLLAQAAEPGVVDGLKATFVDIGQKMGVDGPRLFSQVVLFFIVALVLRRFAYEPVLKVLEQRKAAIQEGIEGAVKIKAELAAAQASRHDIVRQANEQGTKLIEEAKKTAEITAQQRLQEAVREAEQIVATSRAAAKQEREKLLGELKAEMVRLVVDATARATGKVLTPADQDRIKSETLAEASRN